MALDGAYLHHMKKELTEKLRDARVDKIHQPSRDELMISLRSREGTFKLLLSARPDTARVHLTKSSVENPKQPPMLCMLLRKKLQSAKLLEIHQVGLERALKFRFESVDELGDLIELSIVIEIMGKHSNIIIVNGEGKIVDALRRVDVEMSSERLVFPGLLYRDPPAQDKVCILNHDSAAIVAKMRTLPKATSLEKALMSTLQGISPIVSRELAHIVGRGNALVSTDLTTYEETRLLAALDTLRETLVEGKGQPHTVVDQKGKPIDFSFMAILQYGTAAVLRPETSFSALLDRYYAERDGIERMRMRSMDLLKILSNRAERLARKMNHQRAELVECGKKEQLRIQADLLTASLYAVPKSAKSVTLVNYFEPECGELEITLDPALSAVQNAQRYYKLYRKAKTAEGKLAEQIALAQEELVYVDTVFYALAEAKEEQDLAEIRVELTEQGYVRGQKIKGKPKKEKLAGPLTFTTKDGFTVRVGRNNRQNDRLTLKEANNNDLWFHTKNMPGSHTVLATEGKSPTETAIAEAALLAAQHSKAKNSGQVPVDYTQIRHVSKPQGAKPGMVIYTHYKTLFVTPKS